MILPPKIPHGPRKTYRTWLMDSRRWDTYSPRKNDVVIATHPKSGTTWVQRIVNLLIFQSLDVIELDHVCPWWERRTGSSIGDIAQSFEAQLHQRCIKTHLPLDGLPLYDEVKYIHVVRDGRDVALSYHNHCCSHTPESIAHLDIIGMQDSTLQLPYPKIPADPAEFFHKWLTTPAIEGQLDGSPFLSYFEFEKTYARALDMENFLFIHYEDLLFDLVGQMGKIADFLKICVDKPTLEKLAKGASFKEMQAHGEELIPLTTRNFFNGAYGFFNVGQSGRWRGVFNEVDLQLFHEKIMTIPQHYVKWMLSHQRFPFHVKNTDENNFFNL